MAFEGEHEHEAARPSIDTHPAFPAIVALWFACLLGIGSLVLPAVLLDRVVSAAGLASWLPAASPPLGTTARSIVALAAALGGAALGAVIARRVARSNDPQGKRRPAGQTNEAPRPIRVREELGGADDLPGVVNGAALPMSRRRAQAISEDGRASDFVYRALLPGEDADAPAPFAAVPIVASVPDDEPLELSERAQEHLIDETAGNFEMTDSTEAPPSRPSHRRGLDPLPFAAPSFARRAPEVEAEPESDMLAAVAVDEAAEIRADWQTAPLDGLGLVQLVQRLASAIERRRERMAQVAAQLPAIPSAFAEPDFEPAAAEDAVQAMAAFFGSAPAADIEMADDEAEGGEQGYSSLLGMSNPFAAPKNAFVRVEEPEERTEFAEPAVVFPGQEEPAPDSRLFDPPGKPGPRRDEGVAAAAVPGPQVPADADAALRAALATLQRMSGAA
jgi:hypothetical protein